MELLRERVDYSKENNSSGSNDLHLDAITTNNSVRDHQSNSFNLFTSLYLLIVGLSGIMLNSVALSRLIITIKVCIVNGNDSGEGLNKLLSCTK